MTSFLRKYVCLSKSNTRAIFRGDNRRIGELPVNLQGGVVPCNRALRRWIIEVSGFVEYVSTFGQNAETVCETRRNPQQLFTRIREVDCVPLPESRRIPAQVYGHIENLAHRNAYQLALRTNLIVQAAHYVGHRIRVVVLYKTLGDARFRHGSFVVAFQKKASGVTEHIGLENKQSCQRGWADLHDENDRLNTLAAHPFPEELLQVDAVTIRLH